MTETEAERVIIRFSYVRGWIGVDICVIIVLAFILPNPTRRELECGPRSGNMLMTRESEIAKGMSGG